MPSESPKQHRTMEAAANNPAFAKKMGIPQSVGSEFVQADKKAGKYAEGGMVNKGLTPAPPEFIERLKKHGLETPQELERALNAVGHTLPQGLAEGGQPRFGATGGWADMSPAEGLGVDQPTIEQLMQNQAAVPPLVPQRADWQAPETSGTAPNATPTAWQGAPSENQPIGYDPYRESRLRMNTAEGMMPETPDLKAPNYAGEQAATEAVGKAQAAQTGQVGTLQEQQQGEYARLIQTQTESEREAQDKIKYAMDIARTDPRHLDPTEGGWSGIKHVTAAIAAILGGMGANAYGGRNIAVEVLEKQIDRQVGLNKDYVAHLETQYGDQHQANLAARIAFRDQALMQIDSLKNTTQSPIVKANADLAVKQLQVKQQQDVNAIHQNIFVNKMEGAKLATEQGKFMLQYSQGLIGRTVMDQGKPIIAPDEAAATDGRNFVAAQQRVMQSANQLIGMAKQGRTIPYTQRAAQAEGLTATLQDDWRQLQHSGVFKESELSFIKGIIDNPLSLTTLNPAASVAKLRQLSIIMERAKQAKFSTWPAYQGSSAPAGQAAQYMRKVGSNG